MEVEKDALKMNWKVEDASPHYIIFQFSFDNPEIISTRGYKDILKVSLLDQNKFIGANSKAATKFRQAEYDVPALSPLMIHAGQFS